MALTKIIGSGVEGISNSSDATAITIDSSENVGIGTASPTAVLDVRRGDADGKIAEFHTSTGYGIELGSSQTLAYIRAGSSQSLKFETNDANERMRLDTGGNLFIGATAEFVDSSGSSAKGIQLGGGGLVIASRDGSVSAIFGRSSDDGQVVQIRQDGNTEGTISVSGSTVSYGGFVGLHESSGIATSTPVGTVVSTIDELDVYPVGTPKAGQNRADHAKVKVSDAVGDKRVYGVVQKFDAEYYNKLQVASVGVGSVRVTGACAGGDLLESNGDGTAKVQSDDIVRSKTIGKVTIGNSDTGVKLVSCVLYCG